MLAPAVWQDPSSCIKHILLEKIVEGLGMVPYLKLLQFSHILSPKRIRLSVLYPQRPSLEIQLQTISKGACFTPEIITVVTNSSPFCLRT